MCNFEKKNFFTATFYIKHRYYKYPTTFCELDFRKRKWRAEHYVMDEKKDIILLASEILC